MQHQHAARLRSIERQAPEEVDDEELAKLPPAERFVATLTEPERAELIAAVKKRAAELLCEPPESEDESARRRAWLRSQTTT